jgi:adenylate cyclase
MPRLRGALKRPFGSLLLGRPGEPVRVVIGRVRILLTVSIVTANLVGAASVFVLAALVIPTPEVDDSSQIELVNLVAAAVYAGAAILFGVAWGTRVVLRRVRWLLEGREPDEREQRLALRLPGVLFRIQGLLWLVAAALFTTVNGLMDPDLIALVALTVSLGGLVTCANAYLLSEFALRPIAARALEPGPPDRLFVPGVTTRTLLAWALGSGVPVLGLMIIAVYSLSGLEVSDTRFAVSILVLGGVVIVFGLLLAFLAARAIGDPVRSVRRALTSVERGDLDVELPVYDGTEIGLLQAGFNRMVAGLRERERIRDLFGRHVGEDVAHAALEGEAELGGEVRDVAVLFVDIVGSTTLAADRPPTEVVELLNRFFAVVVDVVTEHGGIVDKFEGDAALAVFGAPVEVDDSAGRALATGRDLAARLREEVPDLDAGIGIAAGPVVAGNVGEERRYEYTVIGDPVNEAARLSEQSKDVPGLLVASAETVERAGDEEARRWQLEDEEVTLRGRTAPTRLATPVGAPARG